MTSEPPMAVFDTNVHVSGFLSPTGPPGKVLDWLALGAVQAVTDLRIAWEYEQVLNRRGLKLPSDDVAIVLETILRNALWVTVPPQATITESRDPDDIPFAECALASGVVLVTGNRRHYPKSMVRDLLVWSPRRFVNETAERLRNT